MYEFHKRYSVNQLRPEALIISFYGGKAYYTQKASDLNDRLKQLSVDYEICEFAPPADFSWPDICKAKVFFYHKMLTTHRRPIFWIDVDAVILSKPDFLRSPGVDLGAFLRNFQDLRDFDPFKYARLFHPGYLLLNNTPAGVSFVEFMLKLAREQQESVTDDYILQEAVQRFPRGLTTTIFSSSLLSKDSSLRDGAIFIHGDSGHVKKYKQKVIQHPKRHLGDAITAKTIGALSEKLLKAGKRNDCIALLLGTQTLHKACPELHTRLLTCLAKAGRKRELLAACARGRRSKELLQATILFELSRAKGPRALKLVRQLQKVADRVDHPAAKALLSSRAYLAELDERARTLNVPDRLRPRLWWWDKPYPGNFGDVLNPYLVEKICGIPPKFVTKGPRIFSCGSLLPHVKASNITVWGSGSPRRSAKINPEAKFLAVRGPLSREVVLSSGGECPEIYGDPALLLPRYYQAKKQPSPRACGLILHHYHSFEGLPPASEDVELISIIRLGNKDVEDFIDQVAGKELILSTSLHGIIVAHAYGVPAVWCSVRGQMNDIPGDDMKFHDYFMTVGLENLPPIDLMSVETIGTELAKHATLPKVAPDLDLLLKVCPFGSIPRSRDGIIRIIASKISDCFRSLIHLRSRLSG
jgi:hypothetical protein